MEWSWYLGLKVLHIVSFVSWMAGMLYLPRLFVYHARLSPESEASETFKTMERRLLRGIMNPAMILTFASGLMLVNVLDAWLTGWFHIKLTCVLLMACCHGYFSACRKRFLENRNTQSPTFYQWMNEIPTVLLIAIVVIVVFKP